MRACARAADTHSPEGHNVMCGTYMVHVALHPWKAQLSEILETQIMLCQMWKCGMQGRATAHYRRLCTSGQGSLHVFLFLMLRFHACTWLPGCGCASTSVPASTSLISNNECHVIGCRSTWVIMRNAASHELGSGTHKIACTNHYSNIIFNSLPVVTF